MEDVLKYTASYSFPMVVAVYLLVRFEGKLAQLTDSITLLRLTIEKRS